MAVDQEPPPRVGHLGGALVLALHQPVGVEAGDEGGQRAVIQVLPLVGQAEKALVGPDDVAALRAEEHHGQGGVNHGVFGGGVHVAGVAVQIFVQLPAAAHRGLAAVQGQQEHQSQLHQGQLPAEGGGQQGE